MTLKNVCRVVCACMLAGSAASCDEKGAGGVTVPGPLAGLRYVNTVSDTGGLDIRVVDIVGDAPATFGATFRTGGTPGGGPIGVQTSPPYLAVEAGTRHIRAFNSSSDPVIAQQVLLDTTFTFQESENYTFALRGFARTGQSPKMDAVIQADQPPAAAAGQIAVRTWHLAPGLDPAATTPLDAWVVARGPAPLSGTPTIAGQSYNATSAYVSIPTGTYRVAFTAAGTTEPVLFQANMPTGGSGIGGTTAERTAITVLVVPRTVPGSAAPAGAAAGPIDSIVRVADTAIVYSKNAHGLAVNDIVRTSDATDPEYNGSFVVVATGTTAAPASKPFFRYLVTGTPASPAAGTPVFRAGTADFTNPNVMFLIDRRP